MRAWLQCPWKIAKLGSRPRTLLQVTGAKAMWTETVVRARETDAGNIDEGSILWLQGEPAAELSTMMSPADCVASDLAALMATSGSTGAPRFVMVSHGNLIANTEAIIRSQGLASDDRAMLVLPLSYCFGASVLQTHLYQGGSVVFDRRFMFPDKVLHAISELGCTTFAGVPTVYNVLLRRSEIRADRAARFAALFAGWGRLGSAENRRDAGGSSFDAFYVMYGQTEATARISCMDPNVGRRSQEAWAGL